jgi:TatA/E family protein of Tat protein translocase
VIGDILQPTHLLFILVVALLVLGPKRLPELARTLGSGLRDFRAAINGEPDDRDRDSVQRSDRQIDPQDDPTPQAPNESSAVAEATPEPESTEQAPSESEQPAESGEHEAQAEPELSPERQS